MSEDISSKVKKIVADHLGIDEAKVLDDSSFIDDLGADSLDTVELVMAFEEEFGSEISDSQAEKILTVGDAVKFIEGKSNLVFYDATLQGGMFSSNNKYTLSRSDINTHVFNASIGLAVFYNNIGLELHNFYMTPEFKSAYDFRWGRVKLIFKI